MVLLFIDVNEDRRSLNSVALVIVGLRVHGNQLVCYDNGDSQHEWRENKKHSKIERWAA